MQGPQLRCMCGEALVFGSRTMGQISKIFSVPLSLPTQCFPRATGWIQEFIILVVISVSRVCLTLHSAKHLRWKPFCWKGELEFSHWICQRADFCLAMISHGLVMSLVDWVSTVQHWWEHQEALLVLRRGAAVALLTELEKARLLNAC